MIREEILIKIDQTLDQLIQNAETLQNVDLSELSFSEMECFQKTQESLIHHFLHMDELLEAKRKAPEKPHPQAAQIRIQQKWGKFEGLRSEYHRRLAQSSSSKKPLLSKRRKKRLLPRED